MFYLILADLIVLLHFAFVLFIATGGFLVLKWRHWAWLHMPSALYGVLIEFFGWICPLTPLENWLRAKGGSIGYQTGFLEHYILPLLYPAALTRGLQIALGLFVLSLNAVIYAFVLRSTLKTRK